ncbi:MAG: CvpA family protein [Xanthomonadales bacterium]|nr:CvpA family protein [Xanthomonadales bacterium]
MNAADALILAVLAVSMIAGLVRGLVVEAVALLAWLAAVFAALRFGPEVAAWFEPGVALPSARLVLGYGAVFLAVLVAGALAAWLLRGLVRSSGLSGTDRVLGLGFGLVRGIAVAAALVLLAGLTPLTRDPWWRESRLLPPLERLALWMAGFLPPELAGRVSFPPRSDPGGAPAPGS